MATTRWDKLLELQNEALAELKEDYNSKVYRALRASRDITIDTIEGIKKRIEMQKKSIGEV